MQVVSDAMIITKTGKRTASLTILRINETVIFEQVRTSRVASPKPRLLTTEPLTASSGHSPSSWTSAGLLLHNPLRVISPSSTFGPVSATTAMGDVAVSLMGYTSGIRVINRRWHV